MPVDQDRVTRLLASAAFDCRFYEGHVQDRSRNQIAMGFVGTPGWAKVNGWPALRAGALTGTVSAAVAPIVDMTGAFTLECLLVGNTRAASGFVLLGQLGAGVAGGFLWYWGSAAGTEWCQLFMFDLAAASIWWRSPVGSVPPNRPIHVLQTVTGGGAACSAWVNGVPVVTTGFGVIVPANCGNRPVEVGTAVLSGSSNIGTLCIVRALPFAVAAEDATTLSEQAKLLIGGAW